MDKTEKARNQIILLYIISRIPGITVGELTATALDTCYMNYFAFAAIFDTLYRNSLITKSVRKGEELKDADGNPVFRCDITSNGQEILNRLQHTIPEHVQSFLNNTSKSWEKSSHKNVEVKANFDPDFFGGYFIKLSLSDGTKDRMVLCLSIPTKEMAVRICNKWKENTQECYLEILSFLSA
jgi:hypothetical protein